MKNLAPVIIIFLLLLAGVAFFLSINNKPSDESQKSSTNSTPNLITPAKKLIIGDATAKATLVEYFDYKCPSCNNFHRTTGKQVVEEFVDTNKANIEIRIIPIIGADSKRAGFGAYCANDQNLFSEYNDAVLDYMWDNYYASGDYSQEFNDILSTSLLAEIVSGTAIDQEKLKTCIDSEKHEDIIKTNLELASEDEIRGTPGFAVGEQSFVGGQPISVFRTLLNLQLED